jgi:Arc/MetJ-type ribon-helix-helix transcriptional regulator
MRSTISISLPKEEVSHMKTLAKQRGFATVSEYIRYLISESSGEIITNQELLHRSTNADSLHKQGKLKKLSSLSELIDA